MAHNPPPHTWWCWVGSIGHCIRLYFFLYVLCFHLLSVVLCRVDFLYVCCYFTLRIALTLTLAVVVVTDVVLCFLCHRSLCCRSIYQSILLHLRVDFNFILFYFLFFLCTTIQTFRCAISVPLSIHKHLHYGMCETNVLYDMIRNLLR